MPIPKEILAVKRPSSTVVKKSGERWIVIKRTSKRVGKKVVAVDVGQVGEIINYEYHEIRKLGKREEFLIQQKKKIATKNDPDYIDEKDYGQIAICVNSSSDLVTELEDVFGAQIARTLYVMAIIRTAYNDVRDRDFDFIYRTSYLSNIYPGLDLCEDTLSKFLMEIGQRVNDIDLYMASRVKKSASSIVIDGILKDSNASTNFFCEFSKKAGQKGTKDYSQIFLYNLNTLEPIASFPYPGNMLNLTTVKDVIGRSKLEVTSITWCDFIDNDNIIHKIPSALLMGDDCFYTQDIATELDLTEIPYLLPLKRDSKYISEYHMDTDILKFLKGYNHGHVCYKKVVTQDNHYLYTFRDPDIAAKEEKDYLGRIIKDNEEELRQKRKEFGTITFISATDLEPVVVYLAYMRRWSIEDLFLLFKSTLDLNTLNVQKNYRLYSTEFINFISAVIASRVWNIMKTTILQIKRVPIDEDASINENTKDELVSTKNKKSKTRKEFIYVNDVYSFKELFINLSKLKMRRVDYTDNWEPVLTINRIKELCEILKIQTK